MSRPPLPPLAHPLEGLEHVAPRARPVQKRAIETVDLILETAAKLVDEVGIEAFNTNLLSERAGVRIRTIYRYFPNKLAVLTALLLRLNEESDERLGPFAQLADPAADWRAIVGYWIDDIVTWTRERPGARLAMSWGYGIPELLAVQERLNEEWTHELMGALRTRGLELPERRLYAVARSVIEVLDMLCMLAVSKFERGSEEIVAETRRWLESYLAPYLD